MLLLILQIICGLAGVLFFAKIAHRKSDAEYDSSRIPLPNFIRPVLRYGPFVFATLITLYSAILQVEPGVVVVTKIFGSMQKSVYTEGLHLINPYSNVRERNVRRQSVDFTGNNTARSLSSDPVELEVDCTVPFILNPESAWKFEQRYGSVHEGELVARAARSAIRDCTPRIDWKRGVGEEGRSSTATCIKDRTRQIIIDDLMGSGFTEEEALGTFSFPPTVLRRMAPTNKRVIAAVAEEAAAKIDLKRQETLTEIAKIEAERRKNEGSGINKMMNQLPKDYTVEEMVALVMANSAKTNAEAFEAAVQAGNPNITVVLGGGNPSVAVPTTKTQ